MIGVVGAGLLGGSLLRALARTDPSASVVAVERNVATRVALAEAGLATTVCAEIGPELSPCDLVVLCTPIAEIEALLAPVSAVMRDGSVLSDVGGVKGPLVVAARSRVRKGVRFVGAHPMFGAESGGFAASRAELFSGKVAVCTDGDDEEAIARVESLHRALGAEVIRCTADDHDAAVAVISHLPYVLSSALHWLGRERGELARTLAGRGFDDLTRMSRFAFEVQGEVARRNPHLLEAAEAFEARLHTLLSALDASPENLEAARALFDGARRPDAEAS